MNRDIEFRVWDDHYKYMNYKVIVGIYGKWEEVKDNENYTACSMWIEPKNVDYKCEPHWSHFEPYHKEIKLMQYTGLKDKNGKKIFEGDILRTPAWLYGEEKVCICKYNQENNVNSIIGFGLYTNDAYFKKYQELVECDEWDEFEVIGNIYENKELLEG